VPQARLEESFAIKNNLEFSSRHPMPEKALVIFRFRAAFESTNRIVLSIRLSAMKQANES
jgi:hypothetical protein